MSNINKTFDIHPVTVTVECGAHYGVIVSGACGKLRCAGLWERGIIIDHDIGNPILIYHCIAAPRFLGYTIIPLDINAVLKIKDKHERFKIHNHSDLLLLYCVV